jgi:hypothetical protein
LRHQPEPALVEDADLVPPGQDQQHLRQPGRAPATGGQFGGQRPQQPGVEPVERRAGVKDQDAAGIKVASQGRDRLAVQIAAEDGSEGIVQIGHHHTPASALHRSEEATNGLQFVSGKGHQESSSALARGLTCSRLSGHRLPAGSWMRLLVHVRG